MDKRNILILILLITGAVLVCGCGDDPKGQVTVNCDYNAATGMWDCQYFTVTVTTDPYTMRESTELVYHKYSTEYCSPMEGEYVVRTCSGNEYVPPSPSPSPSPSPANNGPSYKISEQNNGGGGGGGGGGIPRTFP